MAILALDTTTVVATTAVVKDNRVLAEVTLGVQRNHAERILPAVDLVLREAGIKQSDLTSIAVSIGPGSFTGQRIGLSLAKGLAEGLNLPIVPISTLRLLAEQLSTFEGIIVPLLDAQRNQYYGAIFRCENGVVLQETEDQAFNQDDLPHMLEAFRQVPIMLTGEAAVGAGAKFALRVAPPALCIPRASVLALLAQTMPGVDPRTVVPNYIRSSSAKPRKNGE